MEMNATDGKKNPIRLTLTDRPTQMRLLSHGEQACPQRLGEKNLQKSFLLQPTDGIFLMSDVVHMGDMVKDSYS